VTTAFGVPPDSTLICTVTSRGLAARAEATGKLGGPDAALKKGDTYRATSGSCFAGDRMIGVDNGAHDLAVGGIGILLGIVFATAVTCVRRVRA